MYFTDDEIRKELLAHADEIRDDEDTLEQWADGFTPIYYSDIIKDWVELPPEDSDTWKDYGYDANKNDGGIMQLMQIDLVFYNIDRTRRIWQEIGKDNEI